MKKDSIPFGGAMKMNVAFCNGIGIDTSQMKRLIWISGQLSFDEKENFIGKGDMRVQTEQVLKNLLAAERLAVRVGTNNTCHSLKEFTRNI